MYTITLHGFKTKEQADAFASWYEGQGEQDADVASECGTEFPHMTQMDKYGQRWDGDNLNLHLK